MEETIKLIPWDTVLFGRNVYEINYVKEFTFNQVKEIDEMCEKNGACMSFVKVEGDDINTIHSLEKLGFNYIEFQYELKHVMNKKYSIRHLDNFYSLSLVEESDVKAIEAICNIAKKTFDTDRYYIDPKIEKDISGERYTNWILNSFKDENYELYKYVSRKSNDVVSFLMTRKERSVIYLALQGVSPHLKGLGISPSMFIDYFNVCYENGKKSFHTFISGINKDTLNEFVHLGFRISDQKVVLRKFY